MLWSSVKRVVERSWHWPTRIRLTGCTHCVRTTFALVLPFAMLLIEPAVRATIDDDVAAAVGQVSVYDNVHIYRLDRN